MATQTVLFDRPSIRTFTTIAALIAWSGLVLQLILSLQLAVENGGGIIRGIVVYLGYFTILTNILVALALSVPLVAPISELDEFFRRPGVVTTIAAAITVVGIAYHFLLRQIWDPQGLALVADVVLHYVSPVLFLIYWWVAIPKNGLRWADLPKWLIYPVAYLLYALVRGELTGLYPYYFIDVGQLGYVTALSNALGILVAFIIVEMVLIALGRYLDSRSGRATLAT